MRFTGLDPRTQVLRWGLFAVAVGMVLGATAPAAIRSLSVAWEANRASLPWLVERTAGFLAYFAVAGSVVYGLLLSTKILDAIAHRPITFSLHQDLASVGLGLAGVHGALLALDKTVPFSLPQIAIPGLSPHAPVAVAAGQVAFYLLAAVIASFYVRRSIGQRAWRLLHYLTFLAFAGATAHGLTAGTDSSTAWAWWIYVGSTVAVTFLFCYRIVWSISTRRAHRSTVPAAPARVGTDATLGRGSVVRSTATPPTELAG
jgi:hypothetical protein